MLAADQARATLAELLATPLGEPVDTQTAGDRTDAAAQAPAARNDRKLDATDKTPGSLALRMGPSPVVLWTDVPTSKRAARLREDLAPVLPTPAYARLVGPGVNFLIRQLKTTLGQAKQSPSHCAVQSAKVQALHAEIQYNFWTCKFEITALAPYGFHINGHHITRRFAPTLLDFGDRITMGTVEFVFKDPNPDEEPEESAPLPVPLLKRARSARVKQEAGAA